LAHKTSTGYGTRGAAPEDIEIFCKYLRGDVKIKVSSDARTAADARKCIGMGCSRDHNPKYN